MDTDSPFEGDGLDDGEEPSYEWLDEWLCEYVDGTMDPSLEAVFEKYVEANPDLKAHVERLEETRRLLCNCGPPSEPSPGVEAEVCRKVEGDLEQARREEEGERGRPIAVFGLVSSVTAALIVGFLVGAVMVGPLPSADRADGGLSGREPVDAQPPSARRIETAPAESSPRPYRSATPLVTSDSASVTTLTPIGMP
jgi:anti-sigma factor RsiW